MATTNTGTVATTTSAQRGMNRNTADLLWALLFIGPQLVVLIAFSLLPLIAAFYLSLTSWDGFGSRTFVGLQNYLEQLRSPDLGISLWISLVYTLISVPGGLILSLLVAMGVNNIRGKTFYRLFYFMPVVTGSVAVSVVWLYLLNDDFGILNTYALSWFGIDLPSWLTDSAVVMPAIAVIGIWWGLGYNMVIFLAGLQNVPTSLVEAAQIDGANKLRIFRNVTLPRVRRDLVLVMAGCHRMSRIDVYERTVFEDEICRRTCGRDAIKRTTNEPYLHRPGPAAGRSRAIGGAAHRRRTGRMPFEL